MPSPHDLVRNARHRDPGLEGTSLEARFQAWVSRSRGSGLDGLRRKELGVQLALLLLLPVLLPFFAVWLSRSEEFTTGTKRDRVLMILMIPVLLPVMLCAAILFYMPWLIVRRLLVRRKVLREAERVLNGMIEDMEEEAFR